MMEDTQIAWHIEVSQLSVSLSHSFPLELIYTVFTQEVLVE